MSRAICSDAEMRSTLEPPTSCHVTGTSTMGMRRRAARNTSSTSNAQLRVREVVRELETLAGVEGVGVGV